MLYASERTGEEQVYLSRFPDATEDWPVSASGGSDAWFLDDLSAIVFVDEEEQASGVYRVPFEAEPEPRLGAPELLFELDPAARVSDFDGVDRFVGSTSESPGKRELVLTTQWKESLR